jgi:diaminopimelate epimerase
VQRPLRFTKGHGTENDFVLVADADGDLDLGPREVAALCDRRAGIGADGLIRVVRAAACDDPAAAAAARDGADWFMDYRNADGSVAEMCGNGVRVFAAYLLREGLAALDDATLGDAALAGHASELRVGSRGGTKVVTRRGDLLAVDMGGWRLVGGERAAAAGTDASVSVHGLDGVPRAGLSLDLGNPHTVVALAGQDELAGADLTRAPLVDPLPPTGTNVELVVPLDPVTHGEDTVGRLRMRVHERGVGETRSCGTGACAAALAARVWFGDGAPTWWLVDVPGGRVEVRVLDGGHVELAGPAVLVADGVVDQEWLAAL